MPKEPTIEEIRKKHRAMEIYRAGGKQKDVIRETGVGKSTAFSWHKQFLRDAPEPANINQISSPAPEPEPECQTEIPNLLELAELALYGDNLTEYNLSWNQLKEVANIAEKMSRAQKNTPALGISLEEADELFNYGMSRILDLTDNEDLAVQWLELMNSKWKQMNGQPLNTEEAVS